MSEKKRLSPQFLHWCSVIELETLLLSLIKSLEIFNFPMFISCLEKIAPWMFAMNHTNYARWLPIFIHDLKLLQPNHPGVYKEFCQGKFPINKSGKPFSSMDTDQAHEQNNRLVKIDGGATALLNDNAALLKWTVSGPEIAEMVRSFCCNDDEDMEIPHHHKDTDTFEKQFREDVKFLCDVMRELGNPFTDTDSESLHIVSKTIMAKESVNSVKSVLSIGENQYNDCVSTQIIKCEVPIYEKIKKNNLSVFREKNKVSTSKGKMKAVSLKE